MWGGGGRGVRQPCQWKKLSYFISSRLKVLVRKGLIDKLVDFHDKLLTYFLNRIAKRLP